MVPLHPETCPGSPDRLRWIVPAGLLTFTGLAATVPAPLAVLLADGTLAEVAVEYAAVVTRLCSDRSWHRDGARVRTALHAALAEPDGWRPAVGAGPDQRDDQHNDPRHRAADPSPSVDETLYAAAQNLLDGPVGQFARSHGGIIELVDVRDRVVTVRLGGACHGCPAARSTLHQRLERQLRQRCPALREVKDVGTPGRRVANPRWLTIRTAAEYDRQTCDKTAVNALNIS